MKRYFDVRPPKPVTKAERSQFPGIGTTLSPYRGAPLTAYNGGAIAPPPKVKKRTGKKLAKRIGITLAVVALIGLGWTGFKFAQNADKIFGGNIFGLLTADRLKGEDRGRVNILLAGYSVDDPGHGGSELTDSLMIASIDTQNNTAFLLSIPRDLWVSIPERGYQKINSAYTFGEQDNFTRRGFPEGGIGQLESIITENFGMPIDYYALINYTAFRDAVNAVGGITINVDSDDPRGLYDGNISPVDGGPLDLENGLQELDGQTALNLARARGSTWNSYGFAQSDFTRTKHQRMMLIALKKEATSAGTLSNPLKLGKLFDSIGSNVQTDFQSGEGRRLADLMKKVPDSSITSYSLNDVDGKNLLASYRSPNGQSALIPAAGFDDFSDIQLFIRTLVDVEPANSSTKKSSTN